MGLQVNLEHPHAVKLLHRLAGEAAKRAEDAAQDAAFADSADARLQAQRDRADAHADARALDYVLTVLAKVDRKEASNMAALTSTIEWQPVEGPDGRPDADTTVLVCFEDGEIDLGYYDDGEGSGCGNAAWRQTSGARFDEPLLFYADLPMGPSPG